MAKTFYLDRETDPSNPTLESANNELIKNYETISDMEGDLTNVDDGEVVSTEEADYTSVHISDEVTDGDLNPVTSNAVYDAIEAAKIDRVKGAFVEERTNRLWTDGRPIYRQYVEGTPEPVMSQNRKTFGVNVPVSPTGPVKVVDMYGYWEITENTSYPQIVGAVYLLSSSAMTPDTPHNTSLSAIAGWDPRFPDRISVNLAMNVTTSYGLSEHVKICAVIEYTKMSDTPVEDPGVGPLSPSSGNIAGVILNDDIHYSTTETPTGGTWIDGKPIYRKVIVTPQITTARIVNNTAIYEYTFATELGSVDLVKASYIIEYQTHNSVNQARVLGPINVAFSTGTPAAYSNLNNNGVAFNIIGGWGGSSGELDSLYFAKFTCILEYIKR